MTSTPASSNDCPTAAPDAPLRGSRGFNGSASLFAGAIFIMGLTVLLVAAKLDPDPSGVGTHTRLGMAPCGFLQRTGLPCATCGMTTSFALAADGRLLAAFITQPAGALFAVLTAMTTLISGYAMLFGISLWPLWTRCWRPLTLLTGGAFIIAAWAYKMAITHGT